MEKAATEKRNRNDALDIFRAFALFMMISIHFLRGFINDYPGTWEGVVRYIFESAPVFFFVAFGMTAIHTASGARKWQRILELGIIAFLHQGYLAQIIPFKFDFLLFLWFMLVIATILRPIFTSGIFRLIILVAILAVNLIFGQERFGIWGGNPFAPIPWASLVIIGMMIGLKEQSVTERIRLIIYGLVFIILSFAIQYFAPVTGFYKSEILFTKWHPTTSTYLLLWSGIAILVYAGFGWIKLRTGSAIEKITRTLSVYLLQGVVIHYLTNSNMAKVFHSGGYSKDVVFPPMMLIIAVITVSLVVYFAVILMMDFRRVLTDFLISEKHLYMAGLIIAILLSISAMILSIMSISLSLLWVISIIGMLFAGFAFMDTRKSAD